MCKPSAHGIGAPDKLKVGHRLMYMSFLCPWAFMRVISCAVMVYGWSVDGQNNEHNHPAAWINAVQESTFAVSFFLLFCAKMAFAVAWSLGVSARTNVWPPFTVHRKVWKICGVVCLVLFLALLTTYSIAISIDIGVRVADIVLSFGKRADCVVGIATVRTWVLGHIE